MSGERPPTRRPWYAATIAAVGLSASGPTGCTDESPTPAPDTSLDDDADCFCACLSDGAVDGEVPEDDAAAWEDADAMDALNDLDGNDKTDSTDSVGCLSDGTAGRSDAPSSDPGQTLRDIARAAVRARLVAAGILPPDVAARLSPRRPGESS